MVVKISISKWALVAVIMLAVPLLLVWPDGGYFSRIESVAVSADQRAIIIKTGDEISMTFSTAYSGDGDDFGWIIPTPVPLAVEDVFESGKKAEKAFELLDELTAPQIETDQGCFPAGTEVLTPDGPRMIEELEKGDVVFAFDLSAGQWTHDRISKQRPYNYAGDLITVEMGFAGVEVTGNHSFYVLRGNGLAGRPAPREIPDDELAGMAGGRWVEARDLKVGDVLRVKNGGELGITGLSSREERIEVYHLEIERQHNYAIRDEGILVHNGGKQETDSGSAPEGITSFGVTVFGKVLLEHYEVSILGASTGSGLINWLLKHGYQVEFAARKVLDEYIDENWAFVAVKLNPGEKRRYQNEFLPSLTLTYRHSELIFPLRISSVSTTQAANIALYVIAESTTSSSNFTTDKLEYDVKLPPGVLPEIYVETCILQTMHDEQGDSLVVLWQDEFDGTVHGEIAIDGLTKHAFSNYANHFLTRFEARIDPDEMKKDIHLELDAKPANFRVEITGNNWQGEGDIPALHYAVLNEDNPERISELLESGVPVDGRDRLGATALMYAVRFNRNMSILSMLLDAGANVKAKNERGETGLFYAAGNIQNPATMARLLETGADVALNAENNVGETALMRAAWSNQIPEVISLLLEHGADISVQNTIGNPAFEYAAEKNSHPEVIRHLLDAGADINAKDDRGNTPLLYAAANNENLEVIRLLVDSGADTKGNYGKAAFQNAARNNRNPEVLTWLLNAGFRITRSDVQSAFFSAAANNRNPKVISRLIDAGARVNASSPIGDTALLMAVKNDQESGVIRLLIDAGADVNAQQKLALSGKRFYFLTSLLYAAQNSRNPEVIKWLLDAGAEVNVQDQYEKTVLMHAIIAGQKPEAIKWLLDAGADIHAQNNGGDTALMLAAANSRDPEVIKWLLDAGADVNARDSGGDTALTEAAWSQGVEVISLLLESGASVEVQDRYSRTPLIIAAEHNLDPEVISRLLEAGADVNARSEQGWTVLMYAARSNRNADVVFELIKAGADIKAKSDEGKTAFDYLKENYYRTYMESYQELLNALNE